MGQWSRRKEEGWSLGEGGRSFEREMLLEEEDQCFTVRKAAGRVRVAGVAGQMQPAHTLTVCRRKLLSGTMLGSSAALHYKTAEEQRAEACL